MWIDDYLFPLIVILLGISCGPAIWYFIDSVQRRERREIREKYMELIKEKLDVIKTALAMGKSDSEIEALDKRLEKLIGTEKMLRTLKKGKVKDIGQEAMLDQDVVEELELLRKSRKRSLE